MTDKELMARLADSPSMTDEEAASLQRAFLEEHGLEAGDLDGQLNAAARLLMTGKHEEAIRAYAAIMQRHPEQRGTCESQIGAAYFFLGDFERAIELYRSAKAQGADSDMMDDNIEEATQALAKRQHGEPTDDSESGGSPLLLLLVAAAVAALVYFLV